MAGLCLCLQAIGKLAKTKLSLSFFLLVLTIRADQNLLFSDTILSIDYEYAAMNFLPHDIGNHFCEYAGN